MRRLAVIALLAALAAPGVALAVQPDEILKDPALEARARNLSSELRCMVCQNQSIDDSGGGRFRCTSITRSFMSPLPSGARS